MPHIKKNISAQI